MINEVNHYFISLEEILLIKQDKNCTSKHHISEMKSKTMILSQEAPFR